MADIGEFANRFGSGMRPTLFRVDGAIRGSDTFSGDKHFFIKSAQLPASSIGTIEVPYKGRKIKRPGDRTFAEWSLTILQDSEGAMRADFVNWMAGISGHFNTGNLASPEEYGAEWTITPQAQDGSPIQTITLVNCFPTDVGAVDFSYETTDSISEFTVTMQYDYWYGGGAGENG
tara:strand:- start:24 stop:548 length:525 start_codon:yes stop_codon:yes gene_type:complete